MAGWSPGFIDFLGIAHHALQAHMQNRRLFYAPHTDPSGGHHLPEFT